MTEIKMQSPYAVLGDAFVDSVVAGNRGKIEGKQEGLSDRLRQYAYYLTENMVEAGDALLVNDLLDAAKRLSPSKRICTAGICTSERCERADQCLGGDYDVIASGELTAKAALALAVGHIEHMAAWIAERNAGYSFEGLSEDMPAIRKAGSVSTGV